MSTKHDLEYDEDGASCRACGDRWNLTDLNHGGAAMDCPGAPAPDDLPDRVVDLEARVEAMRGHGDHIVKAHCRIDQLARRLTKREARFDAWATKMVEEHNRYTRQVDGMVTRLDQHKKRVDHALSMARVTRQTVDADAANMENLARALGALEARVNDLAGSGDPARFSDVTFPPAATPEPPPHEGRADVLPLVLADLQARAAEGIKKYCTPLQTHNGRDPLVDAYQEVLDLAMYLRQEIEEQSDAQDR